MLSIFQKQNSIRQEPLQSSMSSTPKDSDSPHDLSSQEFIVSDEKEEGSKADLSPSTARWTRKRVAFFVGLAVLIAGLVAMAITLPLSLRAHDLGFTSAIPSNNGGQDDPQNLGDPGPFIPSDDPSKPIMAIDDFPDPGLLRYNGTWYAYGTNPKKNDPTGIHVPVAVSTDFRNWTVLKHDALPNVGTWEKEENHWAPDVIQRNDSKFVMFYSGQVKHWGAHHCVGASVSEGDDPSGPYTPLDTPFACPKQNGGAIDPSPFRDADGTMYVVYKGDGNSIGHGGGCNNGKYPIVETPIYLQQLESDAITPTGDPIVILYNTADDGPLIEAPRIVHTSAGIYYLTFSSHCFNSFRYNIKYATATNVKGPYTRAETPLLKTGDYGLAAPGGASISEDGTKIVFHANCPAGRCMFASAVNLDQSVIEMVKLA